ncbi:MAG: leucine--tRNA ligase [bacterium]|nr:leucine--tRNA ligase [bacterium]
MVNENTISQQAYPFKEIEEKWRNVWEIKKYNHFDINHLDPQKKKYILCMFLYPSGDKLHIGHWWNYGPTDTYARLQRMKGYQVFEPMGFDAFGLPAENYAIKHNVHPAISTKQNIDFIREQLKRMGNMYDWNYEINTSSPEYYKWTQWLFLTLYKLGLVEYKTAPVNWCPKDQTVLANEQVQNGHCERCGSTIEKRKMAQWFFTITKYADKLLEELERPVSEGGIDWPERTKNSQKYWIGKSEGALVKFPFETQEFSIDVFTTRPDTLYGVTYVVIAPEHPLVVKITSPKQFSIVQEYVQKSIQISEIDRLNVEREKTGVFTGSYCIHPLTKERIPIWIADYVIESYGTGAVMAVPAHDDRDFQFAKKYNLPIKIVIKPNPFEDWDFSSSAYCEEGIMVNSEQFTGLTSKEGTEKIIQYLELEGIGKKQVTYRLRDWSISRQRYWGAPIPIIHCPTCGVVPVPEKDLPVLLPENVAEYRPAGKSPLETVKEYIQVTCPKCLGTAKRDPDTMDTFVCSSWYYLRFPFATRNDVPFDYQKVNEILPVDVYVGGTEHTYGHLLYARFITHVLYDAGYLKFKEPFKKMVHQGVITRNGARMSKSRGNVVNPEPLIDQYGSDVFRMYLMFMGDYAIGGDWNDGGISGVERLANRIWRLILKAKPSIKGNDEIPPKILQTLHRFADKVQNSIDHFKFNTAVAALMTCVNELTNWEINDQNQPSYCEALKFMVLAGAPLAPHLFSEAWERLGGEGNLFDQKYPIIDQKWLLDDLIEYVIQVNGKIRGHFTTKRDLTQQEVLSEFHNDVLYEKLTKNLFIKKEIVVPNKLINIVADNK